MKTENLKSLVSGIDLSYLDKKLAKKEFELLLELVDFFKQYYNKSNCDIYSLKLHEAVPMSPAPINGVSVPDYSIMRVPGGWIYSVWNDNKESYVREMFVPYSEEFLLEKSGVNKDTYQGFFRRP